MHSPRTSPVFRIFSADSGEARASRLTTGVPIMTVGVDGFNMFTLNPTDLAGVCIIVAFSFPLTSSLPLVGAVEGLVVLHTLEDELVM